MCIAGSCCIIGMQFIMIASYKIVLLNLKLPLTVSTVDVSISLLVNGFQIDIKAKFQAIQYLQQTRSMCSI